MQTLAPRPADLGRNATHNHASHHGSAQSSPWQRSIPWGSLTSGLGHIMMFADGWFFEQDIGSARQTQAITPHHEFRIPSLKSGCGWRAMARFRGRASVPEKAANGAEWKLVSGDDNDPQSNVRVASYHHIWQEKIMWHGFVRNCQENNILLLFEVSFAR